MYLAVKGYTELEIEVSESVRVKAGRIMPELKSSTQAIAKSLNALLRWEIQNHPNQDKAKVVLAYFKKIGWHVEPLRG